MNLSANLALFRQNTKSTVSRDYISAGFTYRPSLRATPSSPGTAGAAVDVGEARDTAAAPVQIAKILSGPDTVQRESLAAENRNIISSSAVRSCAGLRL